jgi:hypothetical protein
MASLISKPVRTALHQAWRRLQAWAADPRAFEVVLSQAFGTPAAAAQALRRDLLGRQWAIPLEVSTDPALTGVQAAYIAAAAHGGERIIVNGAWAASVGTAALEAVILEEIGHAIDRRLHGDADSRGDEGEIFSALVRGASPSARAAHERDQHTLVLAGTPVTVEASARACSTATPAAPAAASAASPSPMPAPAPPRPTCRARAWWWQPMVRWWWPGRRA